MNFLYNIMFITRHLLSQKRANLTLFDELISMYDNNKQVYTQNMSAKELYEYRLKHKPTLCSTIVSIDDVFKTIYERDLAKEGNNFIKKNEN